MEGLATGSARRAGYRPHSYSPQTLKGNLGSDNLIRTMEGLSARMWAMSILNGHRRAMAIRDVRIRVRHFPTLPKPSAVTFPGASSAAAYIRLARHPWQALSGCGMISEARYLSSKEPCLALSTGVEAMRAGQGEKGVSWSQGEPATSAGALDGPTRCSSSIASRSKPRGGIADRG